jgi:hypothetical protein
MQSPLIATSITITGPDSQRHSGSPKARIHVRSMVSAIVRDRLAGAIIPDRSFERQFCLTKRALLGHFKSGHPWPHFSTTASQ